MIDYRKFISEVASKILKIEEDIEYFKILYLHNHRLFKKYAYMNNDTYYENYRFFYDIYSDLKYKRDNLIDRLYELDYYLSDKNVNNLNS